MDTVRGLRIVRNQMRLRGWKVIEVSGWETRGMNRPIIPKGAINHWTAGPRTGNAPSLNVVVYGRTGLRNALCHTYQDRRATLYIVAACIAWHAGVGSWPGLRGNTDCLGHEPECSGPGDWRPGQLELMADLDTVQADVFEYPFGRIIDHFEWATPKGRKSDRSDVGGPPWRIHLMKEDNMPTVSEIVGGIMNHEITLANWAKDRWGNDKLPVSSLLRAGYVWAHRAYEQGAENASQLASIRSQLTEIRSNQVSLAAIVDGVVKALPPGQVGGIDTEALAELVAEKTTTLHGKKLHTS